MLKRKGLLNTINMLDLLTMEKTELVEKCLKPLATFTQEGMFWIVEPPNMDTKRVCLVAHIDTVWESVVERKEAGKEVFFDRQKGVMWSPYGLGADDRAGVFALYYLFVGIPEEYKPILLFTDGEESGGIGAKLTVKYAYEYFQDHVLAFISLDRHGNREVVHYNNEPDNFKEKFTQVGFKEKMGTFGDLSILCPYTGLCGANVSAGYVHEHTEMEHLYIEYLENTISMLEKLIPELTDKQVVWELPELNIPASIDQHRCFNCNALLIGSSEKAEGLCYECSVDWEYQEKEACCGVCLNCDNKQGSIEVIGGCLCDDCYNSEDRRKYTLAPLEGQESLFGG